MLYGIYVYDILSYIIGITTYKNYYCLLKLVTSSNSIFMYLTKMYVYNQQQQQTRQEYLEQYYMKSQKLKTIQMSVRTDKYIVVQSYHGISNSNQLII